MCGRRRQDDSSVLLNKGLQNRAVPISAINRCDKLLMHWRRRWTVQMVAFGQDIAASAHAYHLMAEPVDTRGIITGTKQHQHPGKQGAKKSQACRQNVQRWH